jgi:ABC-type uncharacterized transport system involved in gliding motility auxiliary subunit
MERVIEKLPPIFAALGLLGLLVAGGLYVAGGDVGRYAVPLAAASLCLLIYYFVERPDGLVRLFTGRSAKYGGNALLMSVSFLAILALLNVLGNRYSFRADLTESQQFTLSPQTVKILTGLQVPVKAIAFVQGGTATEDPAKTYFDQFTHHTKNLTVEYVDPQVRPGLASQYNVTSYGTTVFEANTKRQRVVGSSEGELISGLVKVTRGEPKKIYFLIGHGEADPNSTDQAGYSQTKEALEAENYAVLTLNLVSAAKVPDDASAVVLAGPTSALQPSELKALTDYLDKGGKALVLADTDRLVGLPELADRFDVEIKRGFVIEFGQSLPNDPLTPIIAGQGYLPSPITNSVRALTLFPTATLVAPKAEPTSGQYEVTPLAQTTDQSWLETDLSNPNPTIDIAKDVIGPVRIAVSVMATTPVGEGDAAKTTRLVLIGDIDFATNNFLNYGGNHDFLVNSVNWLAEDEDLISVRAKDQTNRQMILSGAQMNLIGFAVGAALPLLVLGLGAWVYWGRR